MHRSLIIILLFIPVLAFSQNTIDYGYTFNFRAGVEFNGEPLDSLTFHGSDSITFYSGANSVVSGGASEGITSESDPVYAGDSADIIFAEDTTAMLAPYIHEDDTAAMLSPYAKSSEIPVDDSVYTLKTSEQTYDSIAFSSTINLDLTTGADYVIIQITGDCTINISDLLGGESMIILYMDGTGGHTVTLGTGFTDKEGEGTINTGANARTVIQVEHVVGPGGFEDTFYMIL